MNELRIARAVDFPNAEIEEDVKVSIEKLTSQLEKLGDHIKETVPNVDHVAQSKWGMRFFRGGGDSLQKYNEILYERESFIYAWEKFLRDWDTFLCPALNHTGLLLTINPM